MHKKASENTQGRVLRAVEFSTQNDYGINSTVFRRENEKLIANLRERQNVIEFKLAAFHRHLAQPNVPKGVQRSASGDALHQKLVVERHQLREELAEVTAQHMAAKTQREISSATCGARLKKPTKPK